MNCIDWLGFTTLTVLLVGGVNWGTTAIRYAANDLPTLNLTEAIKTATNYTGYELYAIAPTPDLLQKIGATPDVQMGIYWAVFVSGIIHLGLFVFNSFEFVPTAA